MSFLKIFSISAVVILSTLACTQRSTAAAPSNSTEASSDPIDQSDACMFRGLINTGRCKPGKKLILLPNEGAAREELSLMFAAQYCDMRYAVIANTSGVICIYHPTDHKAAQTPESAEAAVRGVVDAMNAPETSTDK